MLTIGMIGAGAHSGLHHGGAFAESLKGKVRATIADLDLEKAKEYAARYGLDAAYADVTEMIDAEKPDALVVITPESVTARVVKQLIGYGLPMLVEKPFGQTLEQTRELCGLVEEKDASVMISFNRRFSPVCRGVKALLDGLDDFPPRHIRATMLRHNRNEKGFLTATGIHVIDAVNMLAGAKTAGVNVRCPRSGNGYCVQSSVAYDSGCEASILIDTDCGLISEVYEVFGDGYYIHADFNQGYRFYRNGELETSYEFTDADSRALREGAVAEMEYFVAQLSGKGTFVPGPEDALAAAVTADEMERCFDAVSMSG